jgi:hypothetical protein
MVTEEKYDACWIIIGLGLFIGLMPSLINLYCRYDSPE